MNSTTKKIKSARKTSKKSRIDLTKELEKMHTSKKTDNIEGETEAKISAIEYYNSLSEVEKREFDKELEKKKVRDNYVSYLKYVYGKNYVLTKFHLALANVAESIVRKVENGQNIVVLLSVPPQFGKGYPVDFPILTTKGWKKHGDLQVGDYVYNDKGEQVAVLGNQKPYMHECLKITFATGEEHIITREHLWKVLLEKESRANGVHHNFREEHILEAQEIMNLLPKCRRSPAILINKPLFNEDKELPINPYVLGLWLGDGISANNEIVVGNEDLLDELVGIGESETYSIVYHKGNTNVSYIKLGNKLENNGRSFKWDFTKRLSDLGVHNNKHIPTEYLLASENQRWELLKGLMDTDGTIGKNNGLCEYCGINKKLCEDVLTLVRSLGIKATLKETNAKLNGKVISKKYRVCFVPNKGQQIFKIRRKQERLDNKKTKDREDKFKYFITSIVPVENQLVSCISVEGGMYLAGKGLIPTHNSKTITECLPSWFIMRNPDKGVILCSYNADFAEKFGDSNRQKVKDFGKGLFGLEVSDSQDNKTLFQIKKHEGQVLSTGIFGTLTGNPASLLIIDDPYKSNLEADSEDYRNKVYGVVKSAAETRLNPMGSALVIIHTRWHEDDLIGRYKEEDGVIYINIPCVWESTMGVDKLLHRKAGEVLAPELGHTTEWVERKQKSLGKKIFNALYQGKPFIEGGNIVQRKDLKWYNKKTIPQVFEELTMSCDLSFGGQKTDNDPSCITIWGRVGADHYLLKIVNKRMSFNETLERLQFLSGEFPTMRKKIVEKKANGSATIEMLNSKVGGFIPYDPKGDSKETRLRLVAPYFESGNVYFPEESVEPNIEEYVNQLLKFPSVAHDDFVDTISQYLINYSYKYGGKIRTDSYYNDISDVFRGIKI